MFLFIFEMLIARIYPHIERRIGSMIEESGHSTQHWHGMAQLEVKKSLVFLRGLDTRRLQGQAH